MNKIKIILADDHVVVRRGLRYLIDSEADMIVIGEVGDGLQLLDSVEKLRPDVVLVDIKMPILNGIDAADEIRRRFPGTHTVILSMHSDYAYVERAMQAGVCGYVMKEEDIWEMCTAIRHAAQGNRYLSARVTQEIPGSFSESDTHPDTMLLLTLRERQVLQLVAEGRTNGAVAKILGISVRTVEGHRAKLMAKLNMKTPVDLVHYALKHGIYIEQEQ